MISSSVYLVSQRIRKLFKTALWIFLGIAALMGLAILSGFPEGYCYLYPKLGTVFAQGYTDSNFNKVVIGMSARDVQLIIGEPLFRFTNQVGVHWYYSYDKKDVIPLCDFAWLSRCVVISNGVVVDIEKRVYFD